MEINEEDIFQLIAFSGSARSEVFEAFHLCSEGKYTEADVAMESARENLLSAHRLQTRLIQREAAGDNMVVKLLMVHAQDHLMTGILAKDIMENMMDLRKEVRELRQAMAR